MQVILLENIKNLGKIGDIVKVERGYARNYLIKFEKALFTLTISPIFPRFLIFSSKITCINYI